MDQNHIPLNRIIRVKGVIKGVYMPAGRESNLKVFKIEITEPIHEPIFPLIEKEIMIQIEVPCDE